MRFQFMNIKKNPSAYTAKEDLHVSLDRLCIADGIFSWPIE
jgi:hypothetical protein